MSTGTGIPRPEDYDGAILAHRGFVSSSVVLLLDDGSLNERTAWFNQICDFMAGLAWEKELHWKIIVAIGKANGGDEGALGRVQQVLQPIIHKSHFYDKALNTRSQLVEFLRWVPKVQGYRQPLDLTRELSLLRIRLRAKHSLKWLLYLWVSTNVSCKGRVSH
ncbi:hypothetical protein CC1G_08499 [Coprinopsis cinerea okayama7|uniref:Uncharacterized protein n=1 Tax=Coprinopsis cinerea (strain Okayama-7 / 130 / ATCC MYA-4618 / FGSC 9003) TaxID=240176 RepID=A8ND05_COPC7|nr:hypothetical protein CC1G_08499 [Coprinopsis cinerea okayama7\|eukprot:XP_001832671.2 hypothetical protein CC1G_08499 [Coprinopsis cinerea okayama7\